MELLVVIGIIALLISVLLPALNKAREAAKSVKCLSNLRQIGTAMLFYANENKGVIVHSLGPAAPGDPENNYDDALAKFLPGNSDQSTSYQRVFLCPSRKLDMRVTKGLNYSANICAMIWNGSGDRVYKKYAKVTRPTEVIAIGDGNQAFPDGGSWLYYDYDGGPTNYDLALPTAQPDQPIDVNYGNMDGAYGRTGIRYRHGERSRGEDGSANVLFFDGHCQSMRIKTVLQKNISIKY